MKETQWTHLSLKGMVSAFEQHGIKISTYIVRYLLKIYRYGLRKMVKSEVTGNNTDRNAQFEYINSLLTTKKADPNVVILSIDSKKKENLGTLYRQGKVYTKSALAVFDHDYPNLSEGKVIPHGIYNLVTNQCYMNLGISHDTAQFARDSLIAWWDNEGSKLYATATEIVLLSDGGGSNRSSGYLYKQAIQEFANHTQINIRICHYPPYCSKYNPIEHRAFPHITRAISGVVLDTVDTIKQLIEQKATTKQGFTTKVNIIDKLYETGKTVAQEVIDTMQIIVDKTLGKWNYLIKPIPSI